MKKLICILLVVIVLCGCGAEETVTPDFVLTYAENQPANYPTTLGALRFAQLVEERTGGKVVIQVKYGGELGTQEEVIRQMKFGGIDFARVSLSSISDALPVLNVLQLPFLYEDSDHMWRILDGEMGEDFLQVFSEENLVGLSWYDAGARCFYSDIPIYELEDMAGLRVRVQESQMMIDMVELLGAVPVTYSYNDIYGAFEIGEIDVAENNWPAYEMQKHYEFANYYTLDEHTRVPEIQLASAVTWEKLPQEYRDIILECARESARYQRQLWTQQEQESLTDAIIRGCRVIVLSEAEKQEFRQLVEPLYERYCSEYMDLIAAIQAG